MTETRPNVILFGVGHSGTSVVTRMLHALGWKPADADADYAESVSVRRINDGILSGQFDPVEACCTLQKLPQPWAIKDPRFVRTLGTWQPLFADYRPLLVWLVRDMDAVKASYQRRHETGPFDGTVEAALELALNAFSCWPWGKVRLEYERIEDAVRLFRTVARA